MAEKYSYQAFFQKFDGRMITASEGFDFLGQHMLSIVEGALIQSDGYIVTYSLDEQPDPNPKWGLFAKDLDMPSTASYRKAIVHRKFRIQISDDSYEWRVLDPATLVVLTIDTNNMMVSSMIPLDRLDGSRSLIKGIWQGSQSGVHSYLQKRINDYVKLRYPEKLSVGSVMTHNLNGEVLSRHQILGADGDAMVVNITIVSESTCQLRHWKWASSWTLEVMSSRCTGRMSFSYENWTAINGCLRQERNVELNDLNDAMDVVDRISQKEDETQRAIVDWLRFWSEDGWGAIFKDLYNPSSALELEMGRERFCRELMQVMATREV